MNRIMGVAILSLLALASLTATIGSPHEKETFGIAVADMRPDLFSEITTSFENHARESGIRVNRRDAREDVGRQTAQIRTMIADGVKAIVYIPAGAVLSGLPVRDARNAHIPIVAVYGNPIDSPADTFIGTDNVAATQTLGEYMCSIAHSDAKVAVIRGVIGMAPEVERTEGLRKAIAQCPRLSVVEQQSSSTWSRADGFSITRQILRRHPEIRMIFGQADLLALGAADAVRLAHLGHHVDIFGFDGDLAGLRAVQSGFLTATMAHRSRQMGALALRSAADLIAKRPVPKIQMQSAILVTKSNAANVISARP